jgi:H+-transporting ATPase
MKAAAALIVGFGFLMPAIPWSYIALIWGYCIAWVFIEDLAKREVYRHLELSGKRHRSFLGHGWTPLHPFGGDRSRS